MSVCLDDLNSLPERYRKQIQQQMQAQQINRTARVMAQFVAKGKADTVKRKHHNHPTARTMPNGTEYTFDSRKEAARYDELALLSKAGAIRDMRIQPQFTLKESYITANGDRSHACDVIRDCGEVAPSLQARMGTGGNQIPLTYQMQGFGDYREGDVASSCKQRDFKDSTDLVCSVDCRNFTEGGEINGTLQAKESGGQSLNLNNTVRQNMVVRRLTPLECERLQGFPDGWTDIGDWVKTDKRGRKIKVKGSADSPRYKALGNSIALPPWKWLLKRLCGNYERDATMASLFDGIGGFPLVWEQLNGRGTCLWASEIEEFPIAVTKRRFGTLEEQGDMGCFLFPCGKDEL